MFNQLLECATIALEQCLALNRSERLLVVTDPPCEVIGLAFRQAGAAMCREAVMVEISPRRQSGNEPPAPVGEWFGQFDVAVMPTSRSLSHTQARRSACEKGTRIATLPGITPEAFIRTMRTDWDRLGRLTRGVASRLSGARSIRIATDVGTDISFLTGGRRAKPDDGRINTKGAFGNLPAGEAYLAPLEGSAQGRIVFDGSFPLCGLITEPMALDVVDGRVTTVYDHVAAGPLLKLFDQYGPDGRNIAEFGVGTLDSAVLSGLVLEDEKVKGTIHIALGDNASMGGTVQVPMHLDGVMRSPTVWLDGKLFMDAGVIVSA